MSSVQPFFSVLVVNYNAGEMLQDAINSLKNQTFKDFEVLIVDNDSQIEPIGNLDLDGLPKVRVMREKTNHGFARGNNLGAKQASGKWLALLNP
ncbi:MAG: glycosyltransferase, partial [Pseudomonadota bacterium]